MVIRAKRARKPIIDLTGPAGNAHALLGIAEKAMKDLGRDPKPLMKRMMASDYENLIQEFDKELGAYFILER